MTSAAASGSKQRTAKQNDARRRAIRERLAQRPSGKADRGRPAGGKHTFQIAQYHALEKQVAQVEDQTERERLLKQQEQLGGLEDYQNASLTGAKYGETSKWLVQELEKIRGRQATRLLDVGAITGTAYHKYKSFNATYIDLNPQAEHVEKADFLEYAIPREPFDIVCLSLVVNFVGDLAKRGKSICSCRLPTRPMQSLTVHPQLKCCGERTTLCVKEAIFI